MQHQPSRQSCQSTFSITDHQLLEAYAGVPFDPSRSGIRVVETIDEAELFLVLRREPKFFDYRYQQLVPATALPAAPERDGEVDPPRQMFEATLCISDAIELRMFYVIHDHDVTPDGRFAIALPDGTTVRFGGGAARPATAAEIAAAKPGEAHVSAWVTNREHLGFRSNRLTVGDAEALVRERCPGWRLREDGKLVRQDAKHCC